MKRTLLITLGYWGWVGFACWAGLLIWLSGQPPQQAVDLSIPHLDKVLHFVYFAGGGGALAWALRGTLGLRKRMCFGVSLFVMAVMGVIDEWRQTHTPGRDGGDPWDFAADVAGACAGIALALWVYEQLKKRLS